MNFICNPHLSVLSAVLGLGFALSASATPRTLPCASTGGYPSFCAIPPVPHDIRDAQAFKSIVVDTRLAGRSLEQSTETNQFSMSGTLDFADRARHESTPPPPADALGPADTEAFLRDARARATPPARPH